MVRRSGGLFANQVISIEDQGDCVLIQLGLGALERDPVPLPAIMLTPNAWRDLMARGAIGAAKRRLTN